MSTKIPIELWPEPLTKERVLQMRVRFDSGIGCDEIGRNATLWVQLMDYYLNDNGPLKVKP